MKIVLASVFAIFLFSGMKMGQQDVFTYQCSPNQDTLIGNVDNYLQIYRNGKIDTVPDWSICISGGMLMGIGKGKYIVHVPKRMVSTADIWINYHQEKVFEKQFVTRPK